MNDDKATVFIVDDDVAVRDSLTLLIEQDDLTVEAFDGAESFLAACSPGRRGCAIIDLRMPGMDGLTLQEEMSRRGYVMPVIFLTGHGDIPTSVVAIKEGAFDFLTKPITASALLLSINAALAECERRHAQVRKNQSAASRLAMLTGREQEVMALALDGLNNKEVARQLGISHRTVEIHKARIMQKTGTATLLELAQLAKVGGFHSDS